MGNWQYGLSLKDWDATTYYNKDVVVNMIMKYYPEIKNSVIHTGYFGSMDSVLLYSYLREFKPTNILEVGGGTSTKIMFKALTENGLNSKLTCYAKERTSEVKEIPNCVKYVFHEGDFLTTFFEHPLNPEEFDFIFIDGAHEAYFASFFCYEIFEKLKSQTLIHIHDAQEPDVLLEGYQKGWYTLGEYTRNPTITDEMYVVYQYIKNHKNYKVLCKSSDLLEKNFERINFIEGVEKCLYRNVNKKDSKNSFRRGLFKNEKQKNEEEAPGTSFYMIKEN